MEPDVILISDDDEPITPVIHTSLARPKITVPSQQPSPPRTPGRLSLSYGKPRGRIELKHGHDLVTITPVIKEETSLARPKIPIPSQQPSPPRTPGRLSLSYGKPRGRIELKHGHDLVRISHVIKEETKSPKAAVLPAVRTKDSLTPSLEDKLLPVAKAKNPSAEDKLKSIIEKIQKKNEAMQMKAKTSLMLPVPISGPLEPYQRPENVNEVHSSTEGNEMKNNAITRMFDTCREFSKDKDDRTIVEKMWAKVNKYDPLYTTSQKFLDFTQSIHAKILLESTNMHLYLKEFYDELSCLPTFKSGSTQRSSHAKLSRTSSVAGPSTSRGPSEGHEPDTTSVENENEKHIQRLEKLLQKCSKQVKKFEEKEMSIDDLDDDGSIYLLIDRYKKKCLQIWKKLCELNGQKKAQSGRVTEKKFVYEGSRFPEINTCISRLVNRSKSFPDFCDITDLITQCNGQFDLHLRPFQIDTLSREAFKDIGKELKRRRILDYEEHFGCPLFNAEEVDNDPASQDEELNAKLAESSKLGMKKADEMFESYVLKQVELDQLPPKPEGSVLQNDDESEGEGTEKEMPIDVAQLASIESESESESKEEEAENDFEEDKEEAETDIEEAETDIEEEAKTDIEEEARTDIEEEEIEYEIDIEEHVNEYVENDYMMETDFGAIEDDYNVTGEDVKDTIPLFSATPSLLNHCTTKRSLTPELSVQPVSKRPTASACMEVDMRILHDMEVFPKPDKPNLNDENSTDSDIYVIE